MSSAASVADLVQSPLITVIVVPDDANPFVVAVTGYDALAAEVRKYVGRPGYFLYAVCGTRVPITVGPVPTIITPFGSLHVIPDGQVAPAVADGYMGCDTPAISPAAGGSEVAAVVIDATDHESGPQTEPSQAG